MLLALSDRSLTAAGSKKFNLIYYFEYYFIIKLLRMFKKQNDSLFSNVNYLAKYNNFSTNYTFFGIYKKHFFFNNLNFSLDKQLF